MGVGGFCLLVSLSFLGFWRGGGGSFYLQVVFWGCFFALFANVSIPSFPSPLILTLTFVSTSPPLSNVTVQTSC